MKKFLCLILAVSLLVPMVESIGTLRVKAETTGEGSVAENTNSEENVKDTSYPMVPLGIDMAEEKAKAKKKTLEAQAKAKAELPAPPTEAELAKERAEQKAERDAANAKYREEMEAARIAYKEAYDAEEAKCVDLQNHVPNDDMSLEAYAFLYSDGTLIFQRGSDNSESVALHGEAVLNWKLPENGSISLWDVSYTYSTVIFLDKIKWSGQIFDLSSTVESIFGCSNLDLSEVTSTYFMFADCTNLKWLDTSSWKLPKCEDMRYMFNRCHLEYIDVSNWECKSIKLLDNTFYGTANLKYLDLSKWDLSNVTSMSALCRNPATNKDGLWYINLGESKLDSLEVMDGAFQGCKLYSVEGSFGTLNNLKNMSQAFDETGLVYIDCSQWELRSVTNMFSAFSHCKDLKYLDVSNWVFTSIKNLNYCFEGASIERLSFNSLLNTSFNKLEFATNAFYACGNLKGIYSNIDWDLSCVVNLDSIFNSCSNLVVLPKFKNLVKVKSMANSFYICKKLKYLDSSEWGLSKNLGISDKLYLYQCFAFSGIVYVDMNTWDFSSLHSTALNHIFKDSKIEYIDFSNIEDIDELGTDMSRSFSGTDSLLYVDLGKLVITSLYFCFQNSNVNYVSMKEVKYNGGGSNPSNIFDYTENLKALVLPDSIEFSTGAFSMLNHSSIQAVDFSGLSIPYGSTLCMDNVEYIIVGDNSVCTLQSLGDEEWIYLDSGEVLSIKDVKARGAENLSKYKGTYAKIKDVKFHPNGGSTEQQTIQSYLTAKMPALKPATKEGYTFLGWSPTKDGKILVKEGDEVTSSDYYAIYKENSYKLTLKSNDGTNQEESHTLKYTEEFKLPNNIFSSEDYELLSWNTKKDGTGTEYKLGELVSELNSEDNGEIVLYAQWRGNADKVVISFDSNGGTPVRDMVLGATSEECEININNLPVPVRKGYYFEGWGYSKEDVSFLSQDGLGSDYILKNELLVAPTGKFFSWSICNVKINRSTVLKAFWRESEKTWFNKNDGSSERICMEARYIIKFGGRVENGYSLHSHAESIADDDYGRIGKRQLPIYNSVNSKVFLGWFETKDISEEDLNNSITYLKESVIGKELYAGWGYSPQFNTGYGVLEEGYESPIVLNNNYTVESLPTATWTGHTFEGWYIGDRKIEVGDTLDLENEYKLTAKWSEDPKNVMCKVTFDKLNFDWRYSTYCTESYVKKGEKLGPLPSLKSTGMYFLVWEDAEGNLYNQDTIITKDVDLKAKYVEKSLRVTFDAQGGSSVSYIPVAIGYSLGRLPGSKKTGYVLEGWYSEPNGQGTKLTKDTKITESCTYYANWVDYLHEDTVGNAKYVYGAEWSNASNSHVDNYENRLVWHPTSTSTYTSSLHIRFEVDRTVESEVLPLGSVKIRIPKYIWKTKTGSYTGTNNLSANLPKYVEGKVETGRMVFSYYEDGNDYILINNRDLSGGAGVDLTVAYSLTYSAARACDGGASDNNGEYIKEYKYYEGVVPVVYSVDKDLDSVAESTHEIDLYNELHTYPTVSFRKRVNDSYYGRGLFLDWQDSWGECPVDSRDYVYIEWDLMGNNYSCVQSYTESYVDDYVSVGSICKKKGNTIITKIKKSDIEYISKDGLSVTNYAHDILTWGSGYQERINTSATIRLDKAVYPNGNFSKNNSGTSVRKVSGGQDNIMENKDIYPMWYYTEYSGRLRGTPVYNESTDKWVNDISTIVITDGMPSDVQYSSGDCSAKYVWEPETGNIDLSDNDYYFSEISTGCTIYKYHEEVVGDYDNQVDSDAEKPMLDVYVRYVGEDSYSYYTSTRAGNTVTLGDGIVGWQVKASCDCYSLDLKVNPLLVLKPTNRVKKWIQSDMQKGVSSIIKNAATCDIYYEDETEPYFHVKDRGTGDDPANKQIYELTKSNTYQITKKDTGDQDAVIFDVNEGVQDDPVCIGSWNYNSGGRKKRMSSGVFYDLLPSGTTVDKDTIYGVNISTNRSNSSYLNGDNYNKNGSGHLNPAYYNVEMIENWEGSERTMMKISYSLPDSIESTGMEFYYLLHNTYENVIARGTTRDNELAFVNTSEEREKPYSNTSSISILTAPDLFKSLDSKYTDFISYAKDSTHYIPVDAFSWKFDKMVQTNSGYATRGNVLLNSGYDYRLSYTQSDYATGKDIIFYDVLEHEAQLEDEEGNLQTYQSDWNGTFNYVDVSSLKLLPSDGNANVTCAPVVWYSTKPKESFTGSAYDLSNSEIWSTEMPKDKSTITAVAVDCRKASDGSDFILKGFHAAECFIHMTSPKNDEYNGKSAYNEGFVSVRKDEDENPTSEYSGTKVTIHDVTPELHKSAVGYKDTSLFPALVHEDDEISYELRIDNPSEYTINDIVVTDTLKEGLRFNSKDLQVKFTGGDYIDLVSCPRIRYAKEVDTLRFIVNSLSGGESCTIKIPVQVGISGGMVLNHAEIPEVNGVAKKIMSEFTKHEVVPTGLSVLKTNSQGIPLAGATLQLTSENGELIEEWVTTEEPKYFEVRPGTYYVKEVGVPDKYFGISEPIKATLLRNGDLEGSLNYVNVENTGTRVKISKKNPDGGYLGGAELKVYKAEDIIGGKPKEGAVPVVELTSQGKEVLYEGVFDKGAKYVLYEEVAPEGYRKAAPIEFTVPETADEVSIVMVDKPRGANGDIIVEKHVEGTGGDKTREFEFTLTLNSDSLDEFVLVDNDGNVNVVEATKEEGKSSCTFKLSDGKKMRIQGIPNGMGYSIVENVSGYRSDIVNGSGVVNFDDADTCNVLCTNIKNMGIPTGEDCLYGLIWLSLLSILGYVWYIWNRRKHKKILLGYEEE